MQYIPSTSQLPPAAGMPPLVDGPSPLPPPNQHITTTSSTATNSPSPQGRNVTVITSQGVTVSLTNTTTQTAVTTLTNTLAVDASQSLSATSIPLSSSGPSKLSPAAIAGVAVGATILLFVILILLWRCRSASARQRLAQPNPGGFSQNLQNRSAGVSPFVAFNPTPPLQVAQVDPQNKLAGFFQGFGSTEYLQRIPSRPPSDDMTVVALSLTDPMSSQDPNTSRAIAQSLGFAARIPA